MKVVIQRVSSASVTIAGAVRCAIGEGLLVLLGGSAVLFDQVLIKSTIAIFISSIIRPFLYN